MLMNAYVTTSKNILDRISLKNGLEMLLKNYHSMTFLICYCYQLLLQNSCFRNEISH